MYQRSLKYVCFVHARALVGQLAQPIEDGLSMVRLGLAVEQAEHPHQVVQHLAAARAHVAPHEVSAQAFHDDPFAKATRTIGLVVPGQVAKAVDHAAFEHLAARGVQLGKGGLDGVALESRCRTLGDLVAPGRSRRRVHEGHQAGLAHQQVPRHRIQHLAHLVDRVFVEDLRAVPRTVVDGVFDLAKARADHHRLLQQRVCLFEAFQCGVASRQHGVDADAAGQLAGVGGEVLCVGHAASSEQDWLISL